MSVCGCQSLHARQPVSRSLPGRTDSGITSILSCQKVSTNHEERNRRNLPPAAFQPHAYRTLYWLSSQAISQKISGRSQATARRGVVVLVDVLGTLGASRGVVVYRPAVVLGVRVCPTRLSGKLLHCAGYILPPRALCDLPPDEEDEEEIDGCRGLYIFRPGRCCCICGCICGC